MHSSDKTRTRMQPFRWCMLLPSHDFRGREERAWIEDGAVRLARIVATKRCHTGSSLAHFFIALIVVFARQPNDNSVHFCAHIWPHLRHKRHIFRTYGVCEMEYANRAARCLPCLPFNEITRYFFRFTLILVPFDSHSLAYQTNAPARIFILFENIFSSQYANANRFVRIHSFIVRRGNVPRQIKNKKKATAIMRHAIQIRRNHKNQFSSLKCWR